MSRFCEWCPELEAALAEPFPMAVMQQKRLGGSSIDFVAWHHYVHRLNTLVGGGWSMGDPVFHDTGGKLVVGLPVTILGVTRINFGDEEGDKDDYGTAATNAWAQAFKRTLALFGMGLYMYDKKGVGAALDTNPATREPEPRQQSREDQPATDKQVGFLSRLMKSHAFGDAARLSVQGEIEAGMSKSRAMRLIDEAQKRIAAAAEAQEIRADYDDNNDDSGTLPF